MWNRQEGENIDKTNDAEDYFNNFTNEDENINNFNCDK